MQLKRFFLPKELITEILDSRLKSILVLGGSDTGKTTLIEYLIDLLWNNFSLGIVDTDMGQSHIGPPTTIAWAKTEKEFSSWGDLKIEDFYFVGSLSPSLNTQRVLEAVEFIFKKAGENCDKVIIDTTGYIQGFEAIEFKIKKIKILKPDLVIALKKEDELEPILKEVKQDCLSIFRMEIPLGIKQKTAAERALFRENLFKGYFSGSREVLLNQSLLKRWDNPDEELLNKIVSFRNANNEDIALGVIKNQEDGFIWILTPLTKIEEVTSITVGNYKWQEQ